MSRRNGTGRFLEEMGPGHDKRHVGVFGATLVGIGGIVGDALLILVGAAFGQAGLAAMLAFAFAFAVGFAFAFGFACGDARCARPPSRTDPDRRGRVRRVCENVGAAGYSRPQ